MPALSPEISLRSSIHRPARMPCSACLPCRGCVRCRAAGVRRAGPGTRALLEAAHSADPPSIDRTARPTTTLDLRRATRALDRCDSPVKIPPSPDRAQLPFPSVSIVAPRPRHRNGNPPSQPARLPSGTKRIDPGSRIGPSRPPINRPCQTPPAASVRTPSNWATAPADEEKAERAFVTPAPPSELIR